MFRAAFHMNNKMLLLMSVLLTSACAPKYQFLNSMAADTPVQRIYVVMDYVDFVDDVGALYDYDLPLNRERLDKLQQKIKSMLQQKGHESVYFVSRSSGVLLDQEFEFELYHHKKFQEKLVTPPFLIEAQHISIPEQDVLLAHMTQSQYQAMVPVIDENINYLSRLHMEPMKFSGEWFDTDEAEAVLFVHVLNPRVSFAKGFGVALASTAISLSASGGSFYATMMPHGVSFSNAMLFDMNSGQLLWKNHQQSSVESMGSQSLNNYFKDFPTATD